LQDIGLDSSKPNNSLACIHLSCRDDGGSAARTIYIPFRMADPTKGLYVFTYTNRNCRRWLDGQPAL
jgi:hypothetical protein